MTPTDIQTLARQIATLQKYSQDSGVKTSRSQADLLRPLNGSETVTVLEAVPDAFRALLKADSDGKR